MDAAVLEESTDVAGLDAPTSPTERPRGPLVMRWTVDTYVGAVSKGVFPPDLRAELIAGQIVE